MGKLPPSMRSAPLPLSFLKPRSPPPSSPSISQTPKQPLYKTPSKQNKSNPNFAPTNSSHKSSPSPLFHSPILSQATTILNSIPPSSADPNSLLQSYCNAGASPADALSFLRHLSSRFPSFSLARSTLHILLVHSCLQPAVGDISPILASLSLMSSSHFPPNSSSADLAVRALCSAARDDDAAALLLLPNPPSSPTPSPTTSSSAASPKQDPSPPSTPSSTKCGALPTSSPTASPSQSSSTPRAAAETSGKPRGFSAS